VLVLLNLCFISGREIQMFSTAQREPGSFVEPMADRGVCY
jgi:hypothetical protein